jgi:hypothetical protein
VVAVIVWEEEEEDLQLASTMARNIIVIENRTSFPFGGAQRASLRNSKMKAGELKNTASAMEVKLMFETLYFRPIIKITPPMSTPASNPSAAASIFSRRLVRAL